MAQHFFKVYEIDINYMYGSPSGAIEGFVLSRDTLEINDDDGFLHAQNAPAGTPTYEDTGTAQTFDFVNEPPVSDYKVEFLDYSTINGGSTQFELFAVSVNFDDGSTKYYVMSKDDGFNPSVGDQLKVVEFSAFSNTNYKDLGAAVCFTPGTLIRTPNGDRRVETLTPGDLVITADAGAQPLRWIGTRHLGPADLDAHPNLLPIILKSGLLGLNRPLMVSPQHKMMVAIAGREYLIRAKHLAECFQGIARVAKGKRAVSYIHLLLDGHHILFADGAPSESLFPGPLALGAIDPTGQAEVASLFPDLGPTPAGFSLARPVLSRRDLRDLSRDGHITLSGTPCRLAAHMPPASALPAAAKRQGPVGQFSAQTTFTNVTALLCGQ